MSTTSLLGLPPELQVRIYRMVLVSPSQIRVLYGQDTRNAKSILRMLFTCRTIYEIAKPIYYSSNIFHFTDSESGTTPHGFLSRFMTCLGRDGITLVRNIKLEIKHVFKRVHGGHWPLFYYIDMKAGTVSSSSRSPLSGENVNVDILEREEDELRKMLESFYRRPQTRNGLLLLAKKIEEFMDTRSAM